MVLIAKSKAFLKCLTVAFITIVQSIVGAPAIALAAEQYAVIIGVNEYPALPKSAWLRGPQNDARLVSEFLTQNPGVPFKRENITILADGVDGASLPTLTKIRLAMKNTASKAQKGDFVYLHFSGHGTQAPAGEGNTELDGLNELFLPRDIGKWNDQIGVVQNALVDDEIGKMINNIRAKGAFVWAVFDSCHSGTVTRGASGGDEVRLRKILPEFLDIPDDAMAKARENVPRTRGGPSAKREMSLNLEPSSSDDLGGFVAFYAAQTTETTPEMRLPKGKKGRRSQGLFTFTLFQVLAEYPGISYRQLGQEVLRRYGASYLTQPTPLYEGDLDRAVFGSNRTGRISQWGITLNDDVLTLPAGTLHGLQAGSELLLLPNAVAKNADAIGSLTIVEADALSSTVSVKDKSGNVFKDMDAIENGLIARMKNASVEFSLIVALPDMQDVKSTKLKAKITRILKNIEAGDDDGLRISYVDANNNADLRLILSVANDDRQSATLWMAPSTGQISRSGAAKTPSVSLSNKSEDEAVIAIQDNFTRIARATNLLKLGVASGISESIDIKLQSKRKGSKQLAELDAATLPQLFPGDIVYIAAKNTSDNPVDINVLYVGSDYSISHMYSGRVHPGDTLKKGLFKVNSKSFGQERTLIITTPAKPQTAVEDLSFLSQTAVPATRGAGGFKALLREAGFGQTSRGAVPLDEGDDEASGGIHQFLFETMPQTN